MPRWTPLNCWRSCGPSSRRSSAGSPVTTTSPSSRPAGCRRNPCGRSPASSGRSSRATGEASSTSQRFPQPPAGDFFRDLAAGEEEALRLLARFGTAVGLDAGYEPLAGCQAYPAYVAWLALNGSPADMALAFLANLESWGRSCARMRDALRPLYGADAVAFFDFFAEPPTGFEERALALTATGDPASARRAARLLQAYELLYWNTLADDLH